MRPGKNISRHGRDGFHNGNSSIKEKKKNTSKIEKQINPDDATLIDQIIFILFSFFHGQISRINHLREVWKRFQCTTEVASRFFFLP